jgi:hypothetical protein
MQAFVEQFQPIYVASQHVQRMELVGYEKMSIQSFSCQAGGRYMDEARELFSDCERHLEGFKALVQGSRLVYKSSLLFWTEELHFIHDTIVNTISTDNHDLLIKMLARILPADCN